MKKVIIALLAVVLLVALACVASGKGKPPKCPPTCPSPSPTLPSPTVSPSPPPTETPTPTPTPACTPMEVTTQVDMEVPHSTTVVGDHCVTIEIENTVVGWTPETVYAELLRQAIDLDRIGPQLVVQVFASLGNSHVVGFNTPAGCTTDCTRWAALRLRGDYAGFQFTADPAKRFFMEKVLAHEYGHVWSRFYQWETHDGSWESYAAFRGLPYPDPTSMTSEIAAEDYRMCWGTEKGSYSFYDQPHTRDIPGMCAFLDDVWGVPA